jgi:predicted ATPase
LLGNGTRLVTLTGAGGSGKTRLALQVAAELADDFGDGAFFIPLAPVQDAELVGATIEQIVGVRELSELREAEALLVLDSMEHLLGSAGVVSSLLADARNVKLLATSRAPLRVSGEHEYALDRCGRTRRSSSSWNGHGRLGATSRTTRRSPRSADGWTACRSRSSSPRHG